MRSCLVAFCHVIFKQTQAKLKLNKKCPDDIFLVTILIFLVVFYEIAFGDSPLQHNQEIERYFIIKAYFERYKDGWERPHAVSFEWLCSRRS